MSLNIRMSRVTSIDELREVARKSVPKAFFEYCDHGSYSQSTLRSNREELQRLCLRQRVGKNVDHRDLTSTIIGEKVSLPLTLAPVGLSGMQWGDGEIAACRAAHAAGIPYILSTMSICSIEDVAAATSQPFWFQLYVMRDRGFVRELIQRAIAAKCSALFPTLDLPVQGQRHCDIRNGMTVPPRVTLGNIIDVATKPRWALSVLTGKRRTFGNLEGRIHGMEDVTTLAKWMSKQFDPTLSWKDLEWIRDLWPGKIVLKGILDPEDAKTAAALGVSAIVVSNHGGRQLDGALPSVAALPAVVDAVGSKTEVIFDGGIRSGQDVLRALALGANSCMIGRPYAYGLGAGGQVGVARAIEIIRDEFDVALALTGLTSVKEINREALARSSIDPELLS